MATAAPGNGFVLKNALLFLGETVDMSVSRGTVAELGQDLPINGARDIDVRGPLVCPGFVDEHVHID